MRDRYQEIRTLGADVVAIGTGDARYARAFVAEERVEFLVLVDDDASAARAAEVTNASPITLLAPTHWAAGLRALRSGARQHRSGPRPTQLGATFVIAPGGDVRLAHIDRDAADHAPIDAVLAALRSGAH